MRFMIFLFFLTIMSSQVVAQKKQLTYQQVFEFGQPQLLGLLPQLKGWLDDENYLAYYRDPGKNISRLIKVQALNEKASIFIDYYALNQRYLPGFDLSHHITRSGDYSGFVLKEKEDLYYFSTKTNVMKRLTNSFDKKENPTFSPDGRYLAFTSNHNLFAIDIETGQQYQLTQDGSESIYNGWASWVYYEEILRRRSLYKAFWWSPDSKKIAFMRFDDQEVPEFPLIRTGNKYDRLEMQRYPKAGDSIPKVRLGIFHLDSKELVWIQMDESADFYIGWPFWMWDSQCILFQWVNRDQDNIKIYKADVYLGSKVGIYTERQATWVDFFEDNSFYVLPDNRGFILRSNRDGWYHLYFYTIDGHLNRQLTKGDWNVSDIVYVDIQNDQVYFQGTAENATENHLYRIDFQGNGLQKLTKEPGSHEATVSPGGSFFYDTYSSINHPKKIELLTTRGELIREIGDQKLALLDLYDLGKVELFYIPVADGNNLPALWILPADFKDSISYPVIFSVYGGPDDQEVTNSFRDFEDYYLAQNGIIILRVDHRGSGHFGRKGMDLMHRNLGKWEMHDLIAAVKWLKTLTFIDSTRIGIRGSSYGGYLACMALTYGSDYFTHGIAVYPVTDWKLYDAIYTERYMDRPQENENGYLFSSPISHAYKYKGNLLLTHGTLDDNVHFQHSARLIEKFQDLNKSFELMVYVNSRHGYAYPKSKHAQREEINFWFRHFLGKELNVMVD